MEYPARLEIPYQESQSRLSILFRPLLLLPVIVICCILMCVAVVSRLATVFSILFFDHYPRQLFTFNLNCYRFILRSDAYLLLLTDEYPSFGETGGVLIEIDYPDEDIFLSRLLPLVKWLLVLPHSIILSLFVTVLLYLITPICWVVMVFTGRYPQSIFDISSGVLRWSLRVSAYAFLFATDEYPPYSLDK